MKKWLIIILSAMMVVLSGCSNIENLEKKDKVILTENKSLVEEVNNINLSIDPRIEFLSIIIYLSPKYNDNVPSIIPHDTSYKDEVEDWFGAYTDHRAVKLFDSMYNRGFSFDAPPTGMLFLTNTPNLNLREDIDKEDYMYKQCMKRAGGEKKFLKFVEALQEFCEESNFYEFYNGHQDYYKKIIDGTVESLSSTDYISQIEDYYGRKQNSYNIILSGLLYANNYGPSIKDKAGNFNIYSIQGSVDLLNDVPIFGDEDIFKYLVRHEFSHSFVNNLTTKNIHEVNKYKSLLKPIKKEMSNQAYPNWDTTLNEHLVRTVVIRLTEIYDGKEKAETLQDTQVQKGFIYIKSLENLLKTEYEINRDKYPNFEDFYPEIINLLDEL